METTLTAIVMARTTAYLAHVGDSRLYLLRDGTARCLTADHSQVGEMMRLGLLTADEARQHPYRHVINRSLGSNPIVHPDFQRVTMRSDDYYVLCSDGLWSELDESDIAAAVVGRKPQEACQQLGEQVLEGEAPDNLSVVVAHVLEIDSAPAPEGRLAAFLRRTGLRAGAEDDEG
jgi:protein phosphatase